jgi:hypothetical protein
VAKVRKRYFRFSYPEIESVVSFNIYVEPDEADFTQVPLPFTPKLTVAKSDVPIVADKYQIDLSAIEGVPDGVYDVAVTAVENSGNESDPLEVEDVPLDLTPPPAPTDAEIVVV